MILMKVWRNKGNNQLLVTIPKDSGIKEGDIVRVVSGPFKGEKAKVTRLDKTKSEVVVELLEAAVPIPITINLDSVKVIKKEENGKD